MTLGNSTTTPHAGSLALTDQDPLDLDSLDLVSAITNTPDDDASQTKNYPVWFQHLIRHLRNYRRWRLIIKSDNTIDLEYLAALALQAQQRARPYSPAPQLNLFPYAAIATDQDQPLTHVATPVIANSALGELHTTSPAFTVITGANRGASANAITLPTDILTIEPGEQLHEFLRRVADAAVTATIYAYGSQESAFARLGSKAPTYNATPAKPVLTLAPTPATSKIRAHKARS